MSESREMSRAADRFAAAVEEFSRQVERLRPIPQKTEDEADRFGVEAVREYRRENVVGAGGFDGDRGSLSEEEIREWTQARERRRQYHGYNPI